MSQLDATLTRVPLTLTLTFDLQFSRSNCISGMEGPFVMEWKGWESIGCPDVKHYGNESTGCCADWGTFDLEFSRSNCISGMGGSIVMERKGQESLGCPDVKCNHYVTPRQRIFLRRDDLRCRRFHRLVWLHCMVLVFYVWNLIICWFFDRLLGLTFHSWFHQEIC